MRILVCGDRHWTRASVISRVLLEKVRPGDVIIHGAARGADSLAGQLAAGIDGVTVEAYPAEWLRYGRGAGPIRNQQMLNSGIDLVLAFHASIETSRGTADMVRRAQKAGVPVEIFRE
jgi:hypothetical protein